MNNPYKFTCIYTNLYGKKVRLVGNKGTYEEWVNYVNKEYGKDSISGLPKGLKERSAA